MRREQKYIYTFDWEVIKGTLSLQRKESDGSYKTIKTWDEVEKDGIGFTEHVSLYSATVKYD